MVKMTREEARRICAKYGGEYQMFGTQIEEVWEDKE